MKLLFKQLFSTINADEENCCDKKQANRTIESENVKESKENLTTKNGTIGRGRGGQKLFEKVSRDAATQIWENYDTFVFDADGVLWTGDEPIPGSADTIKELIRAGKRVLVMTNNSTKTADEWDVKCAKLGFDGLNQQNIVSSALVTAHQLAKMQKKLLKSKSGNNKKTGEKPCVYLLGTPGLQETIEAAGVECFGVGPDTMDKYSEDGTSTYLFDINLERRPFAIVCSLDPHFSYPKVMRAVNHLQDPECAFVVTHEDLTYPGPNPDIIVPAAGVTSTVVKQVSGRTPIIMGKPHKASWEFIVDRLGGKVDPSRTLMVGDRLDTDMVFGRRNKMGTLLVLSGVTNSEDLRALKRGDGYGGDKSPDQVPHYFADSLKDLLKVKKAEGAK